MARTGNIAYRAARKEETAKLNKLRKAWEKRNRYCLGGNPSDKQQGPKLERAKKALEAYQYELCKTHRGKKEVAETRAIKLKGKANTHFL